jgi:hypothetical protein
MCFFGNGLTISNGIFRTANALWRFSLVDSPFSYRRRAVSLLDEFVRMRLYRERASEFELLAETEPLSEARLRYRIIARHYRELADRDSRRPCRSSSDLALT